MFIDHTKQIEKYTNNGLDMVKPTITEVGKSSTTVFDFTKTQETYHMTDGGSFFMPNSVYEKPEGKEETVMEQLDTQMDMSASNRKNQMIVISNTTSSEDLEEMSKDGFSGLDADSHRIITVTDKIKAELAKAGVDISMYGDSLDVEELEEITGNHTLANQIMGALKEADLPATETNIEETVKAYQAVEELPELDDAAKEYLLKNEWEPTIKNLYMAAHSGISIETKENLDFSGMEKQLEQVIKNAGLEVNEGSKENCKWLMQKNIALTVTNLRYLDGLHTLSEVVKGAGKNDLDMQQVLQSIMEAIRDGRRPMDALLIEGFSYEDRAKAAYDTIMQVEDMDIAYCVEQEMTVSIQNLQIAVGNRQDTINDVTDKNSITEVTSVSVEMSVNISYVKAKRQLEETRLAMTVEANYALLKRGISIDTKPLEQVVENLKGLEDQYYKDLMYQAGVETSEENLSILKTTTKYVEELKFQPAYALTLSSAEETIQILHQTGSTLKASMENAMQSYETMWTAPRVDLGDSIRKAFGNIDEILEDLNLEKTELNQRAVRILAYNETEITVENITKIKDVDMELQKLFRNLTPATTLELIRRGENPLEMDIQELNHIVEVLQSETGDKENEKFSKFLWKLEQNKEITAEERESYIGIYRLIAQVEKTDGAAIGALLNQGADITMKNLLTAMRSAKKDVDYRVDDVFESVVSTSKGRKIDEQIMASFQANCIKEAKELLSPEKLAKLEEWENFTPEELLENLRELHDEESVVLEKQYYADMANEYTSVLEASDEVYAFLEKYDQKNSVNNVLAAKRLLDNPSNVFDTLFNTKGKSVDYQEMIAGLKDQILKDFGEAVKTPEAMAEAEATLAEVAERVMQTMIVENEPVSAKDLRDLRLMSQQFSFCGERSKEESFLVPVQTGDSVTGVNLKIVRGKANKGLIDIFFRGALMEKVAASFEAKENGISGVIATTDEETKKLFEENLDTLLENMSNEENQSMDITVTKVDDLSAWQFEKNTLSEKGEKSPVQTKRLYHIAESFIQTMSGLM